MHDLKNQADTLRTDVEVAWQRLHLDQKLGDITELQQTLAKPDAWNDSSNAQIQSKKLASLQATCDPWMTLKQDLNDVLEMLELGDTGMESELRTQLSGLQKKYHALKRELRFSGQFDDHGAILRLSAGVGGTDAQDWTDMLLRMYLRWAEKNNMQTDIIEQSSGEEAGLKSAVISVNGPFAYGKLRSEHGVHRLVRLSPFNSDNLRQTSFALVEVLPQIDAPDEVQIDDKDLKIDVYRAGGHGGQSVNTTDSAVRITHLPTNIVVSIQNERSQLQNKETAMQVLRSKLAQLQLEQHQENLAELKGPTKSAEWGAQIRNYVLHPYTMVKDTRTKHEDRDAAGVLDGKIDGFIEAYLDAQES
jgi:peptide chain release factor 2